MLRRAIGLKVFCVFFIAPTVFAQSRATTIETITEEIHQSEARVRDHVEAKVEGVDTKISVIDTKVGALSVNVEENQKSIMDVKDEIQDLKATGTLIWRGIIGVWGTLILAIVAYFIGSWRQNQSKKDNVDAIDRLADQIARVISVPTEISETRDVPQYPKGTSVAGLDELTGYMRPQHRNEKEGV